MALIHRRTLNWAGLWDEMLLPTTKDRLSPSRLNQTRTFRVQQDNPRAGLTLPSTGSLASFWYGRHANISSTRDRHPSDTADFTFISTGATANKDQDDNTKPLRAWRLRRLWLACRGARDQTQRGVFVAANRGYHWETQDLDARISKMSESL